MTMSATSPVCLQLLPSWCTAANDEESDKRQRLSSLFLRSHTSWPAKSNRSSRGDANSSSCGPRGDVNFRDEVEARAGYSSGSLTTPGSRASPCSASPSPSSASSSSSSESRGGIVLPMMVTMLQSTNQVETFSGMCAVISTWLVDWSIVTIMGNTMPPRDPDDHDRSEEPTSELQSPD